MIQSIPEGMEPFFSGEKLYGDDFAPDQIARWYDEEAEGYADLGNKELSEYSYDYHSLNRFYGFRHLKRVKHFDHVLGFGAAWGHEFEPIIDRIGRLTITDPSETLRSSKIGDITPTYVKPRVDGKLEFPDNSFDLATCFGTLHHIPNVSYILSELIRVLKSGGALLLREPIISMGDWTKPRPGLTTNERGIPLSHFQDFFQGQDVKIVARGHCFTMTYQLQKLFSKIIKKPLHSSGFYIRVDSLFSSLLKGNVRYQAVRKIHRIAPTNITFLVRKN
ncbi:MAG: methyltransferase domain-containing protein [Bacteroidetes bacterium]|nr:methyltransferase domain-containing protein [Bacteroidota bacterium]